MPNHTKTKAKRLGVKSVLARKDKRLAITAFGRGNRAEIATECGSGGEGVTLPQVTPYFTVKDVREEIELERGRLSVAIPNPAENPAEDYLRLKGTLETEFFGREFPGNNVRIQIIHNILDIQKILGLYVTDIIYSVNNLQDSPEDIFGQEASREKVKAALEKMTPYFGYFGGAFQSPPKSKKGKSENDGETAEDKHNLSVIQFLTAMRQATANFENFRILFSSHLERDLRIDWKPLEENYRNRIAGINGKFMEHSATNLKIILDVLGVTRPEEKAEIARDYYRFSILKSGKYLGVNMTKLSEIMFQKNASAINGKNFDSFRKKIQMIVNFLLFRALRDTPMLDKMVARLRDTADDDAKAKVYESFAQAAWEELMKMNRNPILEKFEKGFPSEYRPRKNGKTDAITLSPEERAIDAALADVKLRAEDATPFTKILSFLCNFLEGKEINELLTAYIHKLESIQSFIDTLKELGEEVEFAEDYSLFSEDGGKRAGKIAEELRWLASIGKMKPDLNEAKRSLYVKAIQMLGVPDGSEYVTDEWLGKNVLLNAEDRKDRNKTSEVNPFRNFLARNVVDSRRFLYLLRYTRPEAVRALMANPKIVRYVLGRIPENQADAYYKNIIGKDKATGGEKPDRLTARLSEFSFETLANDETRKGTAANSKVKNPKEKNIEIERLKALTGLYLTVAYIAVKNLVKANARYGIAFSILDRDYALFEKKPGKDAFREAEQDGKNRLFTLVEYLLDRDDKVWYEPDPNKSHEENKLACRAYFDAKENRRYFSKKWRNIFRRHLRDAKDLCKAGELLSAARNDAENLSVLGALGRYVGDFRKGKDKGRMQSYFELYHFLLQRRMLEETLKEHMFLRIAYAGKLAEHRTPCTDLINIAYVSLGYNLARYKNLTCAALFDEQSDEGKERAARIGAKRKGKRRQPG